MPAGGWRLGKWKVQPAERRPPNGPPPRYTTGARTYRHQRRGARVEGADVTVGGARQGERDVDDSWDGDHEEEKESLPSYSVDIDLPAYPPRARLPATETDRDASTGQSTRASVEDQTQAMPEMQSANNGELLSIQAYEAATRNHGSPNSLV